MWWLCMTEYDSWSRDIPIYPYPVRLSEDNKHIGHRNHLCDLAENGVITLEEMKALVRNPKFICKKCGRVAAKEENLCEPVPL